MSKYIPGNQKHLTLNDRIYIENELSTGICFFTVIAVYTKVFGIVESSFVVPVRKTS